MWDVIGGIIGGIFGHLFGGLMHRTPRGEHSAAIRLVGAGPWRGRWRHGYLTLTQHDIRWRPQKLRPGPPVDLPHPDIGRQRGLRGWDHWWLAGGLRIVSVVSTGTRYELAVQPEVLSRIYKMPSVPDKRSGSSAA